MLKFPTMNFNDRCKVESLQREKKQIVDRLCSGALGLREKAREIEMLNRNNFQLHKYGVNG